MLKTLRQLSSLALVATLAGCLIPEKFAASVNVKPDGSYTYKYDGTATHALAAMAIKKSGALPSKDEDALRRDAEKASKAEGVRKLSYLGGGRYDLSIERNLQIGQRAEPMNVISVAKDKEGVVTIAPIALKEKDKSGLRELGIKVDGTVEVRLPPNAQVISHNASGTPGMFSKAYTWKVGAIDQNPYIKFKLES